MWLVLALRPVGTLKCDGLPLCAGSGHCRRLLSHLQQDVERLLLQMLMETLLLFLRLLLLLLFQWCPVVRYFCKTFTGRACTQFASAKQEVAGFCDAMWAKEKHGGVAGNRWRAAAACRGRHILHPPCRHVKTTITSHNHPDTTASCMTSRPLIPRSRVQSPISFRMLKDFDWSVRSAPTAGAKIPISVINIP